MSPFNECLSAKRKRSAKGISKQVRKVCSHFRKSVSTWKRLASSQIARTFEAINCQSVSVIFDFRVNNTIWKALLVGRKGPQEFGEMLARFDVFDFYLVFALFLHIAFKHRLENGRTHGEMLSAHWKTTLFHNQCFVCSSPLNSANLNHTVSVFYMFKTFLSSHRGHQMISAALVCE